MIGGRNRQSIMNSSPSHSCTGLWRKVTQSVQSTLQVASSYETDFLCLVNINTLLRLPRKEVFAHLPHQKVQWPFLFASKWPLTCEVVLWEDHTVEHPLNIARGSIDHPDGIINFVALDCPSDPSLSRMGTSHRIRQAARFMQCRFGLWRLQLPSPCRLDSTSFSRPHPRIRPGRERSYHDLAGQISNIASGSFALERSVDVRRVRDTPP